MTERRPLAEKFTLPNGTVLPNRIAKAAMSEQLARRNGATSQKMIDLYSAWGRGGAGLLITGNVMIDRLTRVARLAIAAASEEIAATVRPEASDNA